MSYSKLHSSLVHSSLWTEPDAVRILFITLLALCDRNGFVYGSRLGIERAANIISSQQEHDPWDVLMSPDPDSSDLMRNPENEGRRIEEVPGGFHLLNFEYYRGLRNDDDRREQNRAAQARWKERSKLQSAKVSQGKPESAAVGQGKPISEAEAEADNANPNGLATPSARKPLTMEEVLLYCDSISLPGTDAAYFWDHWSGNGFTNNGRAMKDWKATIRSWKTAGHLPSQKEKLGRRGFANEGTPPPQKTRAERDWDELQERRRAHGQTG